VKRPILAVIDLLPPRKQAVQPVALDHARAASLAVSLNALAAASVSLRPEISLLWIGPASVLLFLAYLAGTSVVHRHATRESLMALASVPSESDKLPASFRRAVLAFAVAAFVVFAAAHAIARSANGTAGITEFGNTSVGSWLVGLATLLPPLVMCIGAVRIGAFDLPVGNPIGSNAINMTMFFPIDFVQPGSLFDALDPPHALSELVTRVLISLGLAGLVYSAKLRFAMVEPISVLIPVACGLGMWLLSRHSAGGS
jgi:cation:H+ antiporter